MEAQLWDPASVPGLLDPKQPQKTERKRSAARIETSEGGSCTMRGLCEKKKTRLDAEKTAQAVADDKRDERAKVKSTREGEAAALLAAWKLCRPTCACGEGVTCKTAGLELCEVCGDIKKTKCRKATCLAALAPQLLTYIPPAASPGSA